MSQKGVVERLLSPTQPFNFLARKPALGRTIFPEEHCSLGPAGHRPSRGELPTGALARGLVLLFSVRGAAGGHVTGNNPKPDSAFKRTGAAVPVGAGTDYVRSRYSSERERQGKTGL